MPPPQWQTTSPLSLVGLSVIVSVAVLSMSFSTKPTHFILHQRGNLSNPLRLRQRASQNPSPSLGFVSTKSSCTSLSSNIGETPTHIPRAAVSVVVRWSDSSIPPENNNTLNASASSIPRWLLVQRGREPNKGMWSFPGGKIEAGEGTLDAAKRELFEETYLSVTQPCYPIADDATTTADTNTYDMKWHNFGAFACSDSIHYPRQEEEIGFHYVISQCFAEVVSSSMPVITASDDAADARWWNAEEIQLAEKDGKVTKGVWRVLERSEILYSKGLLECN